MNRNRKQITKNTNFWQSLGHALDGVKDLLKEERSFRIHCFLAIIPIILGLCLKIAIPQWCWIVFVIIMVLLAETINTLIENMVDLIIGKHFNLIAKRIKDIGAGGVLITSSFSVIIYVLIFLPKIISLL